MKRYGKIWLQHFAMALLMAIGLSAGAYVMAQFHELWATEAILKQQ